jgi:hypothetical protein
VPRGELMRDPVLIRMGYFKVRVRTHEWAEGEPVSLLDIQGIGKTRMNLLYKQGFSTASRIMRAPVDDLVARLSVYDAFYRDPVRTRALIEDWRTQIGQRWRSKTGPPLPADWQ